MIINTIPNQRLESYGTINMNISVNNSLVEKANAGVPLESIAREYISGLPEDLIEPRSKFMEMAELMDVRAKKAYFELTKLSNNETPIIEAEQFIEKIHQFEEILRPLTTTMFIFGLGHGSSELEIPKLVILSVYRTFQTFESEQNNTVYADTYNLFKYPLILTATGYCLGLVASNSLQDLHSYLSNRTNSIYPNEALRLIDNTLFNIWNGRWNSDWLNGHEYSKELQLIADERFFNLLKEWLNPELGNRMNFDEIYGKYEILSSFVFMEKFKPSFVKHCVQLLSNKKSDANSNNESQHKNGYNLLTNDKVSPQFKLDLRHLLPPNYSTRLFDGLTLPFTRISLYKSLETKILKQLFSDKYQVELIKAGFGWSDSEKFELYADFYHVLQHVPFLWVDSMFSK